MESWAGERSTYILQRKSKHHSEEERVMLAKREQWITNNNTHTNWIGKNKLKMSQGWEGGRGNKKRATRKEKGFTLMRYSFGSSAISKDPPSSSSLRLLPPWSALYFPPWLMLLFQFQSQSCYATKPPTLYCCCWWWWCCFSSLSCCTSNFGEQNKIIGCGGAIQRKLTIPTPPCLSLMLIFLYLLWSMGWGVERDKTDCTAVNQSSSVSRVGRSLTLELLLLLMWVILSCLVSSAHPSFLFYANQYTNESVNLTIFDLLIIGMDAWVCLG